MRIYDDLSDLNLERDTMLTIGAFDGVHKGHQQLIHEFVSEAHRTGRLAALLTFHPHPGAVLFPDDPPRYLTTPGQKAAILERMGLDILVILPFDRRLASTPAHDFIESIQEPLRIREIWVGEGFALGRGREGDVNQLSRWGETLGFSVRAIRPYPEDGGVVSSTRIRKLIAEGDVGAAARLLNRYYTIAGEVVHGAGRGRKVLNIPTANLEVRLNRAIPANGIYAVFAALGDERYQAVANIGHRPSFDNGHRNIEVHILDFDEDIYGCDLVVEFVQFLRPEERFEQCADLVSQIHRDIEQAREVLSHQEPYPRPLWPLKCQIQASDRRPVLFEELSYTADVGIRAYGQDVRELFINAAYGMFSLTSDMDGLVATTQHRVEVGAPDQESLLVAWLDELLYLHDTTHEVMLCFEIEEMTDTQLKGWVQGTRLAAIKIGLKAVTYHDLKIEQTDRGYTATVVFDI